MLTIFDAIFFCIFELNSDSIIDSMCFFLNFTTFFEISFATILNSFSARDDAIS